MKKLLDQFTVIAAIPTQDIDTADITSSYVEVKNYRTLYACLSTEALGSTKKATIQLLQKNGSGGTPKALSAVVEITDPTQFAEVAALVDDLDTAGGYDRVAVKVTCDAAATPKKFGCALLFAGGKRFNG